MGRKKIDLTGQRFGMWTVLGECEERSKSGRIMLDCICDCGNTVTQRADNLKIKKNASCGCIRIENLEGIRYGKLIVIQKIQKRYYGYVVWKCKCDCGSYVDVPSGPLKSGNTKSCGCLKFEMVGDNNPNYNSNLTYEDRIKYRYELDGGNGQVWSNSIMKRDNYTCQICNQHGGKLNSHHLNAWNAFPEQRFDLDNGVTLCTDCHKEFHSEYGYGDNTREQFDEYAASKTLVLN